MSTPRELLAAIEALSLPGPIRILNLSGDQERVISLSGMRRALPDRIGLLSGPGCAASICPAADLYQAIQLSERHPLTLLVAENMLRLPLGGYVDAKMPLSWDVRFTSYIRVEPRISESSMSFTVSTATL